MNRRKKLALMEKYRVMSIGEGYWANGFFEGLLAADTVNERKRITLEDIHLP